MTGVPVHVLLVEDDLAHAEIVRRTLANCLVTHRITHVEDGQAALDYLFRAGIYADEKDSPRPKLILLDLRLPKVDGLEVLRRIRFEPTLNKIPTVVLTTSAAETDVVNAYSHGAGNYLVKPVDVDTFTTMMASLGF